MARTPKKTGGALRTVKSRVKTAKGRKISSTLWLQRQLNDPYVQRAKAEGYRSRAAYKIIEMDEKYNLLKKGARVVDLGAAPGGWTQVAAQKGCKVVGLDLLPVDPPITGADIIVLDFMDESAPDTLKKMLGGEADAVISDMAPNTTGHNPTDHIRIVALMEAAYHFACEVLAPNGAFVCKAWQGGAEGALLAEMKQRFRVVKHVKPKASRQGSAEMYLLATGFRG